MGQQPQEASDSRRQFLKTATAAIGAIIAAGFAIPAVAYVVGPGLKRQQSEAWIPLGPASKVEPGTPTLYRTSVERQTGWITSTEEISVYVLTENGRDYVSMSNICSHLGCRVRWIDGRQEFFCPCHNGVFDKEGQVLDGPPPRPLQQYPTRVEDGQIYILGGVDHG
jgi:menaquinol-cytochrome c reductase iron-sulfur subunit